MNFVYKVRISLPRVPEGGDPPADHGPKKSAQEKPWQQPQNSFFGPVRGKKYEKGVTQLGIFPSSLIYFYRNCHKSVYKK